MRNKPIKHRRQLHQQSIFSLQKAANKNSKNIRGSLGASSNLLAQSNLLQQPFIDLVLPTTTVGLSYATKAYHLFYVFFSEATNFKVQLMEGTEDKRPIKRMHSGDKLYLYSFYRIPVWHSVHKQCYG